ncbi:type VII toxin-antitoxin system HepT family RNase toxin [Thermoflexus hugenholtzii]
MEQAAPLPDLSRLVEVFRRYPGIEAVYLFGSAAEGRLHAESDPDLAVLLRRGTPRPNPLDLLADLARHGFCRVDVVFLDTEGIPLKFEAVRRNRLLYAAEGFDRGEFFSRVVRQYLDFAPYLRVHREAYRRRIFHGAGRSPATPLRKLEEYLAILRRLQRYSYDEFVADPERYGSAECFLQLAIKALLDMGNPVIADLDLGTDRWYRDIPTILAERGGLSPELRERWIWMIGFRNILVHEYPDSRPPRRV